MFIRRFGVARDLFTKSAGAQHEKALHKKSAPRLVLPGFNPGLVIGGARSRNHKKTRRGMTHFGTSPGPNFNVCIIEDDKQVPSGSEGLKTEDKLDARVALNEVWTSVLEGTYYTQCG